MVMIMAVLASVILVSLETARQRTRDSTIKNQIGQLRSLAEALYTFEDGYTELSEMKDQSSADYLRLKGRIEEIGGSLVLEFSTDKRSYCAYSTLVRNEDNVFCVDSLGDSIEVPMEEVSCYYFHTSEPGYGPNCNVVEPPGGGF